MCPWCGHGMWGGGMMIVWIVLIVVIVWAVWTWMARSVRVGPSSGDDAERILRERFARGEIDEAMYQRMLAELRGEGRGNR